MIEFLCTITGLIAGMVIVASFMAARQEQVQQDIEHTLDVIDSEKMRAVANQLKSLSQRVFSDVHAHNAKVEHFNLTLSRSGEDDPEKFFTAVEEIIQANRAMQEQLEDAQKRITQQTEIIEEATHEARTDMLTGMANRRGLLEFLDSCMENQTGNNLIGLLLLDIDHFKSINDSHGHVTGDAVLHCFARSITQACGEQAFPARYGGEEFAIVLTAETSRGLLDQAARIRQFVSEQKIYHEDLTLTVTASAGLSVVQPGDDLKVAYERSDEGLYQAKKSGRNRGCWLSDSGWEPFPEAVQTARPGRAAVEVRPVADQPELKPAARSEASGEAPAAAMALVAEPALPALLDLTTFAARIAKHLANLNARGLPAGCFMVELISHGSDELTQLCWQKTIAIIENSLRGIDLLCLYRPNTACIFLPGCSLEAVTQRAGELLQSLIQLQVGPDVPSAQRQFAVAVGQSREGEEAAALLDRIEQALDEAHDASSQEIVVHNGESTYFQAL